MRAYTATLVRRAPVLAVFALGMALTPPAGLAQEAPGPLPATSEEESPPDSTVVFAPVSPGGAFLRSALVPGWGQSTIGAHTRASFYFTLEATTMYGILRTRKRLTEVASRVEFREKNLREDLTAQGITDFDEIQTALDEDATLSDLIELEDSRRQQQEDWIALGIFLLFLSGADAFVSAHLQDFPAPIDMQAVPVGDGRIELGFRVGVGR